MRQQYKDIRFKSDTLDLINQVNEIVDDYESQNLMLTSRQLYYRLVALNVIENTEKSYKRICNMINDGKLAGLIDWDMFEDRTRSFKAYTTYDNPADVLNDAAKNYWVDFWDSQPCSVFAIVEKDALFGVLQAACLGKGVPLLAARGYPSSTVLREFIENHAAPARHERIEILHFGDHDPSGIDMTRDLFDRIQMFAEPYNMEIHIHRLALNMDQISELKPPPNPAKMTDCRYEAYVRRFGKKSWELDAVEPRQLISIAENAIDSFIDKEAWQRTEKQFHADRSEIIKFANKFRSRA